MEPVEVFNGFFLVASVLLVVALAIIWAIPSGPLCSTCNTHLTEEFKLSAIRKSDNKPVVIKWTSCYRCKTKFNKTIDGIKKNSFSDVEE